MDNYKLLDRDQMEPSILRRKLDPWKPSKADRVKPLVKEILSSSNHHNITMDNPRWETNVYPLYYYYYDGKKGEKSVFARIFEEYQQLFSGVTTSLQKDDLRKYISSAADAEVDLLIEDASYFIFVEAKNPPPGKKAKFSSGYGVHQLVRQYVAGRFLEKAIKKKFLIATLGVNTSVRLELNETEKSLLKAVGEERTQLEFHDYPWEILG